MYLLWYQYLLHTSHTYTTLSYQSDTISDLSLYLVRSSFILRITYPQSSVTPPLGGPSRRRPPGMWRSPEGHTRGMAPSVVATSKGQSRPPGRRPLWPTHTHLLHPWLRNGQNWPYPNQTKPIYLVFVKILYCNVWYETDVKFYSIYTLLSN